MSTESYVHILNVHVTLAVLQVFQAAWWLGTLNLNELVPSSSRDHSKQLVQPWRKGPKVTVFKSKEKNKTNSLTVLLNGKIKYLYGKANLDRDEHA